MWGGVVREERVGQAASEGFTRGGEGARETRGGSDVYPNGNTRDLSDSCACPVGARRATCPGHGGGVRRREGRGRAGDEAREEAREAPRPVRL